MAEQNLNDANVGADLQEMSGETMPQRMGGDGFADPGSPARRRASCKAPVLTCPPGSWPGNSQKLGRAGRQ
jgi:hypothetical protein